MVREDFGLGTYATCELVSELEKRTGVKKIQIPPYENISDYIEESGILEETGPAIFLVIND